MNLSYLKTVFSTMKEAVSEGGKGSYSRIGGLAILASTIGWVTYIVLKTHALPDLGGPALFITSGNSAYAANQVKNVANAIKGNGPDASNPQT